MNLFFTRHGRVLLWAALVAVGAVCVSYRAEKPAVLTDSRNGQKYRAVKIGGKTWMAQNLNYQTGNSWCYENDSSNCEKYGRLYDWKTAQAACSSGWKQKDNGDNGNGTDEYGFSALPGGYRVSYGSFYNVGDNGSWWTATKYGSDRAYNRFVSYDYDNAYEDDNEVSYDNEASYGFSVRCLSD